MNDQSGTYADLAGPGSVVAARMAIDDFGAAKKGMKVEIVVADHQNKPEVGSSIARQWFDVDKVDVIVDVPTSSVVLAVNQIAREKNKVLLVSTGATSDLNGKACTPNSVHWTYDTWSLANGTGTAVVKTGGNTWFFLTADYAFGHALERDTEAVVVKNRRQGGGQGAPSVPVRRLLFVPASGAGFEGEDHRARECGRRHDQRDQAGRGVRHRQKRPAVRGPARVPDRRARARARQGARAAAHRIVLLGLERPDARISRGASRSCTRARCRPWDRRASTPAVLHYLKAVEALKSDADGREGGGEDEGAADGRPVFGKGSVRQDGRKIHPMYLFEVKKPAESKGPWDYYHAAPHHSR